LRLWRGENLEVLFRELGFTAARLSTWAGQFLTAPSSYGNPFHHTPYPRRGSGTYQCGGSAPGPPGL